MEIEGISTKYKVSCDVFDEWMSNVPRQLLINTPI